MELNQCNQATLKNSELLRNYSPRKEEGREGGKKEKRKRGEKKQKQKNRLKTS